MTVAGITLTIAALVGYLQLWLRGRGTEVRLVLGPREIVGVLLSAIAIALLLVVHELLHGLALRSLGHRPSYGRTMIAGIAPALYCTSPGAVLSRLGFVYVALFPGVVLAVLPALWIWARAPLSGWCVLPAAMLLGGTVGDLFLTARVAASPRGTRVEDLRDGVRLYLP